MSVENTRVVVIGYGSPIRGDDAIGPLVADRLMNELQHDRVEIQSRHILTAELAESLGSATLAIFLDASVDGPLGEVQEQILEPNGEHVDSMAHSLGPSELLAWTVGLYKRCPHAVLLTAAGKSFDYANYELTSAAAMAVEPMIQRVKSLVSCHLNGDCVPA